MRAWIVFAGLLAAGCSSSPAMMNTGRVGVVEASALPPPAEVDLTAGRRPHFLGPYDKISIAVLGVPELNSEEIQIDSNGEVSIPLAGTVTASGKTPSELSELIASRLRDGGVRDPKVAVNVKDTVSQAVTVDGAVKMPGIYPVAGASTMMRAIARAQGVSDFADTTHVVIFRTVGDHQMAALYDLRAIRLGAYEDPQVYPNDIIVVGDDASRRLLPVLLQGASALLTPLIYLLR
ncbi:MAG: polysaccharide export protein [Alphaproteobacteria bacterium]|nr:MAG: polysaccharide export protein [Alphaproteobacteria bacterium]